jgi:hypothetical protein
MLEQQILKEALTLAPKKQGEFSWKIIGDNWGQSKLKLFICFFLPPTNRSSILVIFHKSWD